MYVIMIACNITCVMLFDEITYIVCDITILTVISRAISMHFCAFSMMLYRFVNHWYQIQPATNIICHIIYDNTCDIDSDIDSDIACDICAMHIAGLTQKIENRLL